MNLVRSFSSVGGLTLVSRVLGFVRDMLMARFLGAGFASDAFLVAFRLPNMFRALFAEGRVRLGLRARCSTARSARSGRARARLRFAEQALAVLLPFLILFTGLLMLLAGPAVLVLSGGFNDVDARAIRLRGRAAADHLPLSALHQPGLAARRHPQFAAPILGQRRRADPAQPHA